MYENVCCLHSVFYLSMFTYSVGGFWLFYSCFKCHFKIGPASQPKCDFGAIFGILRKKWGQNINSRGKIESFKIKFGPEWNLRELGGEIHISKKKWVSQNWSKWNL